MREHLEALRDNRPSLICADGRNRKAREKITRILAAAREVFTCDGHAGLSLRKVAGRAGVAVGNLTYYFPAKRDLLDAMLHETLADFVDEHLIRMEAGSDSPLETLLDTVEFYVRNARQSHRFFYQVWGYAGFDAEAMKTVRSLYQPIGSFILALVRASNPDLNERGVRRATLQIFALEEGYKLFMGLGPADAAAFNTAEVDVRAAAARIVFAD